MLPHGTEDEQRKAGRKLKKKFLEATPALRQLREAIVAEAEEYGWILALDGRRIPIRSSHAALNSLLQGAGAILTKRWMKIIDDKLKNEGLSDKIHQLGWIHDELQFEVLEGYQETLAKICREAMVMTEKYYDFKCPLAAGTAIGRNWDETH